MFRNALLTKERVSVPDFFIYFSQGCLVWFGSVWFYVVWFYVFWFDMMNN